MNFDQRAKPRHCTLGCPSVLAAQFLYRPYIAAASMENRNDYPAPARRSETRHSLLIFSNAPATCASRRAPKPMLRASAAVVQTSPPCAYCRRRPGHPRHLQESHQLGKKAGPRFLLPLACGTHCSVCGCDPSLVGGDRRSSSGSSLAKFTANRRASSLVSRFGRRAVRRSDTSGIWAEAECAACA